MARTHQLTPGEAIRIEDFPTRGEAFHSDRVAADDEFKRLRRQVQELQSRLYSEGRRQVLVVLQAMDAGGKDGTIRRVFQRVNPQGVRVHSFKVPSREELAHDFLWRVHKVTPAKGMIGVFNRSHYEDVLVVRVHEIVPVEVWQKRYELINDFEKLLVENGTVILKFFLHISREAQKARFQERLDDPEKHWKFSFEDVEKRKFWDAYMTAYQDALNRCTTPWAPWHVIPADQNWYRNLAIMRVLHQALTDLNPQYPEPEGDFSSVRL